jgi:hypothetical protein
MGTGDEVKKQKEGKERGIRRELSIFLKKKLIIKVSSVEIPFQKKNGDQPKKGVWFIVPFLIYY